MSFLRRLAQRLRRPNYFVGRDLEGNRYYEHPSLHDDPRPKRTVQYSGAGDMWKYVGGNKRLAVQWSAWLTHTRPDPPTLEELHADLVRQERMRHRVALLDARDRAEAAASAVVAPPLSPSARIPSPPPAPDPPADPAPEPIPKANAAEPSEPPSQRPPPASPAEPQPQPWTPHAAARGQ
ncbi:hypothetical protein FB451DRAFT_55912 [Mycena latifolia]|nr:hypothetical protein FB451DRAFT_55912 [Mycena latifolia]